MYYEDVFSELNKAKVKYLVTGGVALNLHGIPRMTADYRPEEPYPVEEEIQKETGPG